MKPLHSSDYKSTLNGSGVRTKWAARDANGVMWAFELPPGEAPALGTTGWLLPFNSRGTKEVLATDLPSTDWRKSLRKDTRVV